MNDDDFDTRSIVVNLNGLIIEATILNENTKVHKIKESSYYTWYSKNMIITTQGGFSGHLLHSKYTATYANNQLQEQGQYNYGLKEGKWMKWQLDGKLISVETWKKGMKQGESKIYNNGVISKIEKYKKNKQVGKVKEFDSHGKLIVQTSTKPVLNNSSQKPIITPKEKDKTQVTSKSSPSEDKKSKDKEKKVEKKDDSKQIYDKKKVVETKAKSKSDSSKKDNKKSNTNAK